MFGKLSIFGSIKVSNYPLLLNAELSKSIKSTKKYGKYTFKIFSIDIVFQIDMTLNINYTWNLRRRTGLQYISTTPRRPRIYIEMTGQIQNIFKKSIN